MIYLDTAKKRTPDAGRGNSDGTKLVSEAMG
jgi:hypothetical protein